MLEVREGYYWEGSGGNDMCDILPHLGSDLKNLIDEGYIYQPS